MLIIGAGSTGLSIARELSKYEVDVTVVDRNIDVSFGEVRSSLGFVYNSIGLNKALSLVLKSAATPDVPVSELFEPDHFDTRLTMEGFKAFPALADELDINYKMVRDMIVARNEDDFKQLQVVEEICDSMCVEVEHLDRDAIQALEPNINKDFTRGLAQYGDLYVIYPWEYAIALAENARDNGVKIMLMADVWSITPILGGFIVDTTSGRIKTRYIINAAGCYCDKVAEMAGVRDFDLFFIGALFYIFDKRVEGLVNNAVNMTPRPGACGGMKPNLSGNLQAYNSAFIEVTDPKYVHYTRDMIDNDFNVFKGMFPAISKKDVICSYTGVSPFNTRDPEDHILEVSKGNSNFLNAVVRMPGIAFSPAMAKYMVELLSDQGLDLTTKTDFNPRRKRIPRVSDLSDEERKSLISRDPLYGHIVCQCEEVSEGEIIDAIKRGARSVAGVKYRTRAGMGRCQRNFCGPQVIEIIARELDIPVADVTMKGNLSKVVF